MDQRIVGDNSRIDCCLAVIRTGYEIVGYGITASTIHQHVCTCRKGRTECATMWAPFSSQFSLVSCVEPAGRLSFASPLSPPSNRHIGMRPLAKMEVSTSDATRPFALHAAIFLPSPRLVVSHRLFSAKKLTTHPHPFNYLTRNPYPCMHRRMHPCTIYHRMHPHRTPAPPHHRTLPRASPH